MCKLPLIAITLTFLAHNSSAEKRVTPCKIPAIAPGCLTFHGRLQNGNGIPALRLWHIVTHHEFGVYSGVDAENRDSLDNEHPQLPGSLD